MRESDVLQIASYPSARSWGKNSSVNNVDASGTMPRVIAMTCPPSLSPRRLVSSRYALDGGNRTVEVSSDT